MKLSLGLLVFLVLLSTTLAAPKRRRKDAHPDARSIRVLNQSGARIDIFWVDFRTNTLAPSNTEGEGVEAGGETGVASYRGHEFEIQELPSLQTGKCRKTPCRSVRFTVTATEDQWYTITKNFTVVSEDSESRAMDKAKEALQGCELDPLLSAADQIEALSTCMEQQLNASITKTMDDIQFQASVRKSMGSRLDEYICLDDKLNTTTSLHNQTFGHDNKHHLVQTLFESGISQVLLVSDFASARECAAVKKVIGNKGGVLKRKKSQRPEVEPFVEKLEALLQTLTGKKGDPKKDPVLRMDVLKANKECTVDADGNMKCDAEALRVVNPVADNTLVTVTVVCEAPSQGGALHYPKTGVHINPRDVVGSAVVVQHMDPSTGARDEDPFLDTFTQCIPREGSLILLYDTVQL